jgi:hypothetical protein
MAERGPSNRFGYSAGLTPASLRMPTRQGCVAYAGADCFVVVVKRGNACGAKGAGHPRRANLRVNCLQDEPGWFRRKAAAFDGWREPDKPRGLRPVL